MLWGMTNERVSIDQTAAALGISREAVRLRLRRGTLKGTRGPDGWSVEIPADRPTSDQGERPYRRTSNRPPSVPRSEASREAFNILRDRLARAEVGAEQWRRAFEQEQQAAGELRTLLLRSQQQLTAQALLTAPASAPAAQTPVQDASEDAAVSVASAPAPSQNGPTASGTGRQPRRGRLGRLWAAWRGR
jgi:hypothetical protein